MTTPSFTLTIRGEVTTEDLEAAQKEAGKGLAAAYDAEAATTTLTYTRPDAEILMDLGPFVAFASLAPTHILPTRQNIYWLLVGKGYEFIDNAA